MSNEETIEIPTAEDFDVLAYLDNQPVHTNEVVVYVNVPKSEELHELTTARAEFLEKRRKDLKAGKAEALGLGDGDEDTEYDDRINELIEELEKTALVFKTKTVAPKLIKAIDKKAIAKRKPIKNDEDALAEWEADRLAEQMSNAIASVRVGKDGVENTQKWTKKKLRELEERLYPEQASVLIGHLFKMVYIGRTFEDSLNADFS